MPQNGLSKQLSPEAINSLRHCVFEDLIALLPPASAPQTQVFMANLRLPKETLSKFLLLRVSPELAETAYRGTRPANILEYLDEKYGNRLSLIAGFYRDVRGRLCWTLPSGCVLYGYRSRLGFYNGIFCQPLGQIDKFFLLSSAKFGGPRAIRMLDHDSALFEAGLITYAAPRRVTHGRAARI